jgi:hypothetical protein
VRPGERPQLGSLEDDGSLRGRIFFHLGDDSAFMAVRDKAPQSETSTAVNAARRRR